MDARQQMIQRLQQARTGVTAQQRRQNAAEAAQLMQQYEPVPPGLVIRGRGQTFAQQLLNLDPNQSPYGALMRQIYEPQPDILTLAEQGVLPNILTAADLRKLELAGIGIDEASLVAEGFIRDEYGNWYNTSPKDLSKYIDQGGGGGYRRSSSRRSYGGRGRYASSPRSSGSRGYMAGTEAQYNPTLLGLTSWRI